MKTHKTAVMCCLLSALFLGVSSGAVLVIQTVQTYSGACEKLSGFPGVLQKAGFVPEGTCDTKVRFRGDCRNHTCTVDGKAGHCVAEKANTGYVCVCKPNRPSR
jgi:hypothetical protein